MCLSVSYKVPIPAWHDKSEVDVKFFLKVIKVGPWTLDRKRNIDSI